MPEIGNYTGQYNPYNSNSGQSTKYSTGEAFTKNTNKATYFNPQLLKEQPNLFQLVSTNNTYGNLQQNMRVLAWLCDTEYWKDYTPNGTDSSQGGSYAIASPSVELYVKSYNIAALEDGRNQLNSISINENGYNLETAHITNVTIDRR